MPLSTILLNTVIPFVKDEIISTAKDKATSATKDTVTGGIKNLIFPADDYATELNKIIIKTIEQYEKNYPPTGNFPFYHHKETFAQLSKFILFKDEGGNILETINFNELENVEKPTAEQLEHFYNYFVADIKANDKLKELYIEENYKAKIFDIYRELSLIKNIIEDFIRKIPQSETILKEWIDMIYDNLRKLKNSTALDEINRFEKDVLPKLTISERNKAFMFFVKGLCLNENAKPKEAVDYFEQACILDPDDQSYKAWFLYFSYLFRKSDEVLTQVNIALRINPFDPLLNSIVAMEALDKNNAFIPQGIALSVQNNIRYKRVIYRYYLTKNLVPLALEYYQKDQEDIGELLKEVTVDNFGYLDFYLQLYFIRLLSKFPNTLFFVVNPELRKSSDLATCINYFRAFIEKIADTEKKSAKALYEYFYRIALFLKDGNKDNLNRAYTIYQENKSVFSPFYFNLLKFGFSQAGEFETAVKIFEEAEMGAEEYFFKSLLHERLGEHEKGLNCIREYFKKLKTIDDTNIEITLESIINSDVKSSDLESFYENLVTNKISTTGIFRDILMATKGFKDPEQKDACIKIIENNFKVINDDPVGNEEVINAYCRVLYYYEMWQGIVVILENRNIDSLKRKSLLIDALWHSKLNSTKLLKLLEELRNSTEPQHDKFYIWEIKLHFMLGSWEKVNEIAIKGLKLFPGTKAFEYYLAVSYVNLGQKKEFTAIVNEIDISIYEFDNFRTFIQGLLHFEEYKEAIERTYNYTIKTNSPDAKHFFFTAFLFNYDKILNHCPLYCEPGFVVKIESASKTLFVNEAENADLFKKLIGKRVGEKISLPAPMTSQNVDYVIKEIIHKYEVLLGEIQKEAETPELTGLPMISFKLTEGGSLEEWNQQLMGLFGKSGDERQIFIDKSVNYYKTGQISFLNLTRSVFNDDILDAYFTMINSPEVGYRIMPMALHREIKSSYAGLICIDLPTLIFVAEQENNFNIAPVKKYIISTHTIEYIDNLLHVLEHSKASDLSINITSKGVIPSFDRKKHNERKIEILKNTKAWAEKYCDVQTSTEKLNFLVHFQKEQITPNALILSYLDSISLSVEKNALLVSDERTAFPILYEKNLIISTESYLRKILGVSAITVYKFLAERNYIGIEIPFEMVEGEVIKVLEQGTGYENLMSNMALRNTPNSINIVAMVRMMELILAKEIPQDMKTELIRKLFGNLFEGNYTNSAILPNVIDMIRLALSKLYIQDNIKFQLISDLMFGVLAENGVKIKRS